MSKDTNNKKTSSQTAPQEDKFSYINNLVNNSNKILNNKAISEESKKYSSLFENSLIANQLGKTQELLPGDVRNITGGADYEKVQDILGQGYNIFDGSLNVRKALGDKQSGWAQAGGALNQAIVGEIVGGTIEGTGRLLDIKGSIDLYNGNIKEFDNVLTELGSGLKGWAEHSTPIFGSEEMFSSGWWAKGMVTTASSLSLLIPAMGTVKAIGGLGRALGVLKSMETLSTAGRTAAWLRTGISQAVVSRHMENWLEAREVWDNTLNEYVNNKGLSLEEAEQAASKAVRQSYIFNTAMLTQDLFQYLLIGRKTFGSSEASDKIMSALGKSKSSILGSRAKSLGINMASEGFEEAYQYVVGNEVVNYQMYKDGLASNPVSDKFLSGYMKDNEFWTSVIFGALGAGVHSGVGKMFNKAFYSKKLETNDNLRIENFKKTQEIQKRIYNKLAKAYESNNQEAVESAIEELTYLSALNSYEFGNSDIALETMGMIKDASNEELVAMGLPEDKIDEFKANIDNAINQTKDIFKKLKKNSKIFGDEINKEVTTTELQLEKIDRLINNSEKSITEKRKELEKSQDLKNLSTEEQQILENKLFIDGGKSRINAINEALQKNNQLTEEQRINFETQKAEIEQLVKEKSKANKELVTGLTGSSYLGNVFSDKGLSSISTLFDEEFNSISTSVNDNNVSSREEYLSSLDKSKREKLESLEKRLDKISKANKLYTAELQKELAKHGIFKLRQKELQKNLDYYTSEKYLKEKKQIIEEVRKKQAEAAQQAINDEKVADDTINSKINQNKKTNEAETTTVPGFNEVVENLNNKVKQKTEEQGYDSEIVDFVNNYFNASKNNKVNKQIKKLLDKNKIYNFFSTLNEDSELSDLEQAIYDYFSNPTEVNFNKIKTLAKEDNSYNKESDVFKAEEAIKEIENQAEEEVKAEVIAAKKVVALNQSNEIPETTDNSVETNVLDENEDVFESDIREYKEYDEESSGAVSVEPTSLAWRSSSAMDNLEEDNDVELTKFLENPSIDITEFNAEFEIDEDYLKQNKTLYDKLNSGETLTQEDINNIPIKVYFLNKEGNRVKNRNNEDLFSYLHANDFWSGKNIQSVNPEDLKKELAIFKFNILKKLNNNEKAISKITNQKDGILQEDYEMVLNPATNKKERKLIFKPLSEAIALDENEIEFLFGDSFNQYILGNTIDQESLQHTTATPGALYIKFKKPNGKVFPARVFVRRLDNNDVNALFSILNYAYAQNQTLKTEISKLSTELQKELKSSQFVKDLIDVLGSKATLLDVLNNFVYEGKLSQGKGLNELRKVGNDVFINGKKYNVVDFTTDKQNEIKAELAKKMINISAKKLNQSSYKKILIDNNVVQTHIRLKKGYVTPFSTPTTVISNRLEGDSTNQSSDVEERFDDETTTQSTQESASTSTSKKEYVKTVPIEKGKHYRITGMSEIKSIIKNKTLKVDKDKSFYDNQILNKISKASGIPLNELEDLNGIDNNKELRRLYNEYVAKPLKEKGEVVMSPRAKSNHGIIGFVKEGFFYNMEEGSSYYGSPIIVGNEKTSNFIQGFHGNYNKDIQNENIESNKPSSLNEGFDSENFEVWLYEEGKGYYKTNFNDIAELAELNKPTQPSNKADEIKADIEKELFSKTDSKGRTFTFFSNTKEKDGKITTTFSFNRSDKGSSQRNNSAAGVPVEKALGNKYTIDNEYIPEGAKVVGVLEIRITEKGAGATVTLENEEERYEAEVKLNSNTTYDAELKALESKQEVVEEKNVVDKDNESEQNKLRRFKDEDTDDFENFSTKQTPQKTDSNKLNEAVEVLNKILPKEVAITLQDDLIKIFENGDAAVASFSKAGIILSSFADDTDAYHEAFHAVFRLLLSGKERNSLIENSKNDFLEPTDEQIKILMDRHNLSKEEATDLYYEEILADEFGKYMSNPNEYTFNNKEQKSFFEKLLSWINNILGIKSNREKVFSSIRKGDYSNSKQAKDSLANLDVNSTELAMFNNEVNYMLKSVEILQSDKAKQVFAKAEKNNWDLNKTLTELQIPKEQKQLILDLGINNREEIALELASKYSYTVEVNTAKSKEDFSDSDTQEIVFTTQSGIRYYGDYQENYFSKNKETISKEEFVTALNNNRSINNSSYYANLTVPGGTNYTEQEISTPLITPSIKGHAQFATDKGIGWFRSDDEQGKSFVADNQYEADIYEELGYTKINGTSKLTYIEKSKTRRILEVQSDLFQKGRDKESLIPNKYSELKISLTYDRELHYVNNKWILIRKPNSEEKQKLPPIDRYNNNYRIKEILSDEKGILLFNDYKKSNENSSQYEKSDSQNKKNQFLQLLNKDNNWVTFFVKSIVQDSAKKGYEKVLFPTGNTASKVEGHDTLEEFKREKEDRIKKLEEKNKDYEEKVQQNRIEKTKGNPEATGNIIYYRTNIEDNNNEINQLKQELERVDKEGFGALRPIYNFYENTVTNILKKQGYNAELITDEYGNTWNEVTIKQSRDLSPIVFKTKNRIVESKSEQLSYSNYFESRINKPGNPLSEQQFNSLSLAEQEVLINQTKYC